MVPHPEHAFSLVCRPTQSSYDSVVDWPDLLLQSIFFGSTMLDVIGRRFFDAQLPKLVSKVMRYTFIALFIDNNSSKVGLGIKLNLAQVQWVWQILAKFGLKVFGPIVRWVMHGFKMLGRISSTYLDNYMFISI